MLTSRSGYIIASLLALAVAACSGRPDPSVTSAPPGSDEAAASTQSATSLTVTVNHTDMNRSELTVYVEPAGGVRTVIGRLNAGEQKAFTYEVSGIRNIRLIGVSPSASTLTSPAITVPVGSGVYWDVSLNTVRLRR